MGAREAALAAILDQEYNVKLPSSTVGGKRKQSLTSEPARQVVRAACAVRAAEDQLERHSNAG